MLTLVSSEIFIAYMDAKQIFSEFTYYVIILLQLITYLEFYVNNVIFIHNNPYSEVQGTSELSVYDNEVNIVSIIDFLI